MTLSEIKEFIQGGEWVSIATEIRPSSAKTAEGNLKPFYLSRTFTYQANDTFELTILNFADAYGNVPLAKVWLKGRMVWAGEHPIAPGAQKVNFIADEAYSVTPLTQGFADLLNKVACEGFVKWEVGAAQSVLKKSFLPFGLSEGQLFAECDLMFIFKDMMFWGARNIDGRGFDKEENRPTNLQIPLVRKG